MATGFKINDKRTPLEEAMAPKITVFKCPICQSTPHFKKHSVKQGTQAYNLFVFACPHCGTMIGPSPDKTISLSNHNRVAMLVHIFNELIAEKNIHLENAFVDFIKKHPEFEDFIFQLTSVKLAG
jgi:hypothetical protein